MKHEFSIEVAGQSLTLRSDEDEAYVRRLASFVDQKLKDIGRHQPGATTLTVALTAALTIADELHKLQQAQQETEDALARLCERLDTEAAPARP